VRQEIRPARFRSSFGVLLNIPFHQQPNSVPNGPAGSSSPHPAHIRWRPDRHAKFLARSLNGTRAWSAVPEFGNLYRSACAAEVAPYTPFARHSQSRLHRSGSATSQTGNRSDHLNTSSPLAAVSIASAREQNRFRGSAHLESDMSCFSERANLQTSKPRRHRTIRVDKLSTVHQSGPIRTAPDTPGPVDLLQLPPRAGRILVALAPALPCSALPTHSNVKLRHVLFTFWRPPSQFIFAVTTLGLSDLQENLRFFCQFVTASSSSELY